MKKEDSKEMQELAENLAGKFLSMLDRIGMGNMPDEEKQKLFEKILTEGDSIMSGMANTYYHYDHPDYATMWHPVPEPYNRLCNLQTTDLPIIDEMVDLCAEHDHEEIDKELSNLAYHLLDNYAKRTAEDVDQEGDNAIWNFAYLITLYLMKKFDCESLPSILHETLSQNYPFFAAHLDMVYEDFTPTLISELGVNYLPMLSDFMKEEGKLWEFKKLVLIGVAHMAKVSPIVKSKVQEWMLDIVRTFKATPIDDKIYDETMIDTLAYCCIHTQCAEAKDLLISMYGKYMIPTVMVEGGVNEIRKSIKKGSIGVGIENNLEEFMFAEEYYFVHEQEEDEDEEDEDAEEIYEDEENEDAEEIYEDEKNEEYDDEEYGALFTHYDLSDRKVSTSDCKKSNSVKKFTLRISLDNIKPAIWRKIEVPSNIRLTRLANYILSVMGWEFEHLHHFYKGRDFYSTSNYMADDPNEKDGSKYALVDILNTKGKDIKFEYDYGDGWVHTVKLSSINDYKPDEKPILHFVNGERNCPPEDCGGPWGYMNICTAMQNPDSKDARSYIEWLGGTYDPEDFPSKK